MRGNVSKRRHERNCGNLGQGLGELGNRDEETAARRCGIWGTRRVKTGTGVGETEARGGENRGSRLGSTERSTELWMRSQSRLLAVYKTQRKQRGDKAGQRPPAMQGTSWDPLWQGSMVGSSWWAQSRVISLGGSVSLFSRAPSSISMCAATTRHSSKPCRGRQPVSPARKPHQDTPSILPQCPVPAPAAAG